MSLLLFTPARTQAPAPQQVRPWGGGGGSQRLSSMPQVVLHPTLEDQNTREPDARRRLSKPSKCQLAWVFLAQIPLERQLMKSYSVSTPFLSCPRRSGCCLGNPWCGSAALGTPVTHPQVCGSGTQGPSPAGSGLLSLGRVPREPGPKGSGMRGNCAVLTVASVGDPETFSFQ